MPERPGSATHQPPSHVPPDLVVIGAPKAGTTFLYDLLVDGCGWVGVGKDAYHLNGPASGLHRPAMFRATYDQYVFPPRDRPVVEATATYAYQEHARTVLRQLTSTRIAAVVRDPVERLVSVARYFSTTKDLVPRHLSLGEVVEGLLDGRGADWTDDETLADAVAHGRYEEWVPRWADAVGERLAVLEFAQLVGSPVDVLERLGATPRGPLDVEASNQTVGERWRGVHGVARRVKATAGVAWVPPAGRRLYRRVVSGSRSSVAQLDPALARRLRTTTYAATYAWLDRTRDERR